MSEHTRTIRLTSGDTVLVDASDYSRLIGPTWRLSSSGYAVRTDADRGDRPMHRDILDFPRGDPRHVDHIDGNPLNNRRSNLRVCTHAENMRNRKTHRNNKSGFKGVYEQDGRWRAQIRHNGRKVCIGYFDTPEEAAAAYDRAAIQLHRGFARTNGAIGERA